MTSNEKESKYTLILAMFIFGTIGIFRKNILLPSSMIALARGAIGMLFLLLITILKRKKISWQEVKSNFLFLVLSGILIGFNWILLFEAYRYTSVATATLCYYMAPIFVILVSSVLLKEKLNTRKRICVIVALLGMVFVSGVLQVGIADRMEMKGIFFGLSAAIFYACVVLLNKKIGNVSAYDKTIVQLGIAAIVLVPYALMTENMADIIFTPIIIILLLIVGILHTGVAYALYFGSMEHLKAQTIALFSYIDPIVAIILSAVILKERMSSIQMLGAVLVLGSTIWSELPERAKDANNKDLL